MARTVPFRRTEIRFQAINCGVIQARQLSGSAPVDESSSRSYRG